MSDILSEIINKITPLIPNIRFKFRINLVLKRNLLDCIHHLRLP